MLGRVTQTPAGWFPDPQAPGQLRYWDGAGWTAHTQPGVGPAPENAEGAVMALVLGILPNLPGFLGTIKAAEVSAFWIELYHYAWFVGFVISFAAYWVLMQLAGGRMGAKTA